MKPIPLSQRFYLRDVDHLRAEIQRLALPLPEPIRFAVGVDCPLHLGAVTLPNRFAGCLGMGNDAKPNGLPSKLTHARYARLGCGGYGMLVTEPIAVHANVRNRISQMHLGSKPDPGLQQLQASLVAEARRGGQTKPICLLQLDGSALSVFRKSRDYLFKIVRRIVAAGWDGLQVAIPLEKIKEEMNSTAMHGDVAMFWAWLHEQFPFLLLSSRIVVYEAQPLGGGFGANSEDYRLPDPSEPISIIKKWSLLGVGMVHLHMTYPPLMEGQHASSMPIPDHAFPHEHPLVALARAWQVADAMKRALPELNLMLGGFSWLRDLMPYFVDAWIEEGVLDVIALERFSLAYPNAPNDWNVHKRLERSACCTQCGACTELAQMGAPVGCVLQNPDVYGPLFRYHMRYQTERIQEEAFRCHQCNPAPCRAATPGSLPIPDMMQAVVAGDIERAGMIARRHQHLAELCAELGPYHASGEADCIETVFSGKSVAIRDVQYAVTRFARSHAAIRVPDVPTNQHVVIIGGGPTGLAAAAELLRAGSHVHLVERAGQLGGVPALLIPESRFSGNAGEIDVMFMNALQRDRLRISLGCDVRDAEHLQGLFTTADALLLATGLWQDRYSIPGSMPDGVWGGLAFLTHMKAGQPILPARRAAILAGGDCAMDTAVLLREAGVEFLYILYPASRSEMLWCMDDRWFAQQGVNLLTWCSPQSYVQDARGRLTGLNVVHGDPIAPAQKAERHLDVDLFVDASGLASDTCFQTAWPDLSFANNGCLANGSDETCATVYAGLFAAGGMRNGGASIPQCVHEGTKAGQEIGAWLEMRRK